MVLSKVQMQHHTFKSGSTTQALAEQRIPKEPETLCVLQ